MLSKMDLQASKSCEGQHRVHFTEDDENFGHDSDIIVRLLNPEVVSVHLGFLQVGHRYEVRFIFHCDPRCGPLAVRNAEPPNLNVRILELKQVKDQDAHCSGYQYEVLLELFAYKEKLLKEKVFLETCGSESLLHSLILELNARVLGKGKGTPFLKRGIRCVGVEMEEDSEFSDWQGF